MIGRAEIIVELFGLGLGLFFLAAGVSYWRIPGERRKGIWMTLFAAVFLLLEVASFGMAWQHRRELQRLRASDVAAIQVGSSTFSAPAEIGPIVAGLNAVVAFGANHEPEPGTLLRVERTDGTALWMRIKYRKGTYAEGVVLRFLPADSQEAGFERGYAFSAALLPALRDLGIAVEP